MLYYIVKCSMLSQVTLVLESRVIIYKFIILLVVLDGLVIN